MIYIDVVQTLLKSINNCCKIMKLSLLWMRSNLVVVVVLVVVALPILYTRNGIALENAELIVKYGNSLIARIGCIVGRNIVIVVVEVVIRKKVCRSTLVRNWFIEIAPNSGAVFAVQSTISERVMLCKTCSVTRMW